jgi:uncharacterized protein (DUF2236 family)
VAVLLGAGPTALLLQIAHPLVAEGVEDADTWRRLVALHLTPADTRRGHPA